MMKIAHFLLVASCLGLLCFLSEAAKPSDVGQHMQLLKLHMQDLGEDAAIRSTNLQVETTQSDQALWGPWSWMKLRLWRFYRWLTKIQSNPVKALNFCGNRKVVALTFDDGPELKEAPMILDMAKERGIKVTFFLTPRVFNNKDDEINCTLVKRILAEGHGLESHSFTHANFSALESREEAIREIVKAEKWLEQCLGTESPMTLFRPPYGEFSYELSQIANALGYTVATWNVDTNDWRGGDAQTKIDRWVERRAKVPEGQSSIVLMHDAYYDETFLSTMIDYYQDSGHEFVTMAQCYSSCKDEGDGVCYSAASPAPGVYGA